MKAVQSRVLIHSFLNSWIPLAFISVQQVFSACFTLFLESFLVQTVNFPPYLVELLSSTAGICPLFAWSLDCLAEIAKNGQTNQRYSFRTNYKGTRKNEASTGFSARKSLHIHRFPPLLPFSTCYREDIGIPKRAEDKLMANNWRSG